MTISTAITSALLQAGFDLRGNAITGSAFRRGWDYWTPVSLSDSEPDVFDTEEAVAKATAKPDTDGHGMARFPHASILHGRSLPARTLPVLHPDMDAKAL